MTEKKEKKEVEKKLNFYQKVDKIIEETGFVPKNGRNVSQKYDYVKESDVVSMLRTKMAKYGITVAPSMEKVEWLEPIRTRSGGTMSHVEVDMTYKFMNADNPKEYEKVSMPGEGMDTGDKSINKAITASKKYALLLFFMLPSGDDPEKDETVDAETKVIHPRIVKPVNNSQVSKPVYIRELPKAEQAKIFSSFAELDQNVLKGELKGKNVVDLTVPEARTLFAKLKKEQG